MQLQLLTSNDVLYFEALSLQRVQMTSSTSFTRRSGSIKICLTLNWSALPKRLRKSPGSGGRVRHLPAPSVLEEALTNIFSTAAQRPWPIITIARVMTRHSKQLLGVEPQASTPLNIVMLQRRESFSSGLEKDPRQVRARQQGSFTKLLSGSYTLTGESS